MDPRLVRLYEDELAHLREVGREFAREHPKARYLGLEETEVADPYVERLLEGFAFLTARVRLKLDAQYPRLVDQILQTLYPNFHAPVPSTMIVRFAVDAADPNLARGFEVARGAAVRALVRRGQDTQCEFRTAHAVTLWPLELLDARCFTHAPDLGLTRLATARAAQGGLRIRLRAGGGLSFAQLGLERLALHIAAEDDVAFRLHELALGHPLGTIVTRPASAAEGRHWRDAASILPLGYADDQALLPELGRGFSGHRLLQEAAALPQRLLFFEIGDLRERLCDFDGNEIELVVLFERGVGDLAAVVDAHSLALFCTPAINLFAKRLDRVVLGPGTAEFHVVPDRTRPMDYEVHSIEHVSGHGACGVDGAREFAPLYRCTHHSGREGDGYFALRRSPRRPSERQRQQGARVPTYLGDEVFLSLVDGHHGPYRETLRQLSVQALVTNRDLPVLLPREAAGGEPLWQLDAPGPVTGVGCLRGPTRPISRRTDGDAGWQLVGQLTQDHLAPGNDAEHAVGALRAALRLYGPADDSWLRQADGLRALEVRTVTRRLPFAGPLAFGTGIALELEIDDAAFQGASAFLLGCVLERFFARHAAINSFTQLTLRSAQRGVIKAWPPRLGGRTTA
ncbi:MAG TPA: type VI secretion system baseplate subunit TssF [Rubrivivax sp.]|nr:type VI secretion system baseplate subunit TssF [Pseudomonadota bacterium]HOL36538.1 type VI secretion system baseplate subunit TssF [Rubrivivax sp.]HPP83551.1 type VI secretion system baseplate subunit TssF [Rubrivivax sp.]